ncbi:MAG: hypothetical protein A2268_09755 [Candidatus Raymondbacteria bacterium RifOxyA12_full_50_37]|uniref:MurNAc-LAA domain-containing protein n=1 Tax=Candidatus Raymondbacteria bacterium RIFOXYD12_FULL_49_13 TaxID=1817890 RepID=A0A1F7F1S0_UNCRA|nr:MAG: hypothetical protein A2268_09755 [Candidatus Raymondbacteria bacterium RifOxyA12_full_50_37]OGK00487.1 MAG: hypothetical protein A2519_10800 [Candidatus Raymondbacteria bacterium RIFOXYD12_FULL_49_13]OGK03862.1 MAG: hypothetical protein A2350_13460 [Candidatus Raymondbacteria bacterium RifOxyB12_full_50_8]OGP45383.1 MAG: hypothetical protein A2324_22310 [Candidatus Raymondbacteria bacterium RIFOXYB2_FULL_49_35]
MAVWGILYCLSCTATHDNAWYQPIAFPPFPDTISTYLKELSVVIDPGHGGAFTGAVGRSGLKEKDINLKVAQLLKVKLDRVGAKTYLTRDKDIDFLPQPGMHPREDLLRRTIMCDSLDPDLFISIHHNADEKGDRQLNIAKIFYKLDDTGPSFDAALSLTHSFSKYLGLGTGRLMEGNYFVLRNVHTAAVLGEPSYLSNPEMERLLNTEEALDLEAEAYFRGIVEWSIKDIPRIMSLTYDSVRSLAIATIQSRIPIDTVLTFLTLDGSVLAGRLNQAMFTASIPFPLKNGMHCIEFVAANSNGNVSTRSIKRFIIDRSPASIQLFCRQPNGHEGALAVIRVSVTDSFGLPVRDSTLIQASSGTSASTSDGTATLYLPYGKKNQIKISCGKLYNSIEIGVDDSLDRPFQGFVYSNTRNPQNVTIAIGESLCTSDENSFFAISSHDSVLYALVHADGYMDTTSILRKDIINHLSLHPYENGVLHGKRIVIDPEFGGVEPGGLTRTGIRASDITREIANRLKVLLKQAGAEPVLTRSGDHSIYVQERIRKAEQPPADLYIQVKADSVVNKPYIGYYPNSRFGGLAADCISESMDTGSPCRIDKIVNYVLQQTQCTALSVSLIPLNSNEPLNQKTISTAAESIYRGIICFYKRLQEHGK